MNATTQAPALDVTKPSDRELRIERIFNADRDRVWRAHSEPDLLKQWWGRGNNVVIEKFEFERGGHWRFVEHGPEGTHGFEGRFREIKPQEMISQTFEWDGLPGHTIVETAVFEDLGDGRTKVIATSMFFTTEERDGMLNAGMAQGLAQSYAALDRLLETI